MESMIEKLLPSTRPTRPEVYVEAGTVCEWWKQLSLRADLYMASLWQHWVDNNLPSSSASDT